MHGVEKGVDGFLEAALEEVFVALEGDAADLVGVQLLREVKAMDGVEEEEGPDAVIEICFDSAEGIEGLAVIEKFAE